MSDTEVDPPFDIRLEQATRDMRALFKKYDLGGYFTVTNGEHISQGFALPTWSVLEKQEQANGKTIFRRTESLDVSTRDAMKTLAMFKELFGTATRIANACQKVAMSFESFLNLNRG